MRVRLNHRRLAELVARRSISLNHWAKRIGLSSGHLSQLVNGQRPFPRAGTREKLLAALEVDFDELFEVVEHQPRTVARPALTRTAERRKTADKGPRPTEEPKGDDVMGSFVQDLRYAFRQLAARPAFTATAVLILALGISANTTIFSVAHTALWKPYPYHEPENLRLVRGVNEEYGQFRLNFGYPEFVDVQEQAATAIDIAVSDWEPYSIAGGEEPLRIGGARVSHNLFDVLGVELLAGRDFEADEDRPGADRVVMLSEQLWRSYFGADPEMVGRSIIVNGAPATVIGLVPAVAEYPGGARLWVPLARDAEKERRGSRWLTAIGRITDGTTPGEAEAVLKAVSARLAEDFPDTNEGRSARLETLRDSNMRNGVDVMMMTLVGVAGFLLLIVCANVSQLLLSRAATRGQEMAVRTALGASRFQLVRQLLCESLLIAGVGGGIGVLLGAWGIGRTMALIPIELPAWFAPEINGPVIGYSAGASLVAALLCGMAPVLQTLRSDLRQALYEGKGATSSNVARMRNGLLVAEVAVSLMLLMGAGLLIQNVLRLSTAKAGFTPEGALTVGIDLLSQIDEEPETRHAAVERHLQRLAAVPGAVHVGVVDRLPLNRSSNERGFIVEGEGEVEGRRSVLFEVASHGYFDAMEIPIDRGQVFGDTSQDGVYPLVVSRSLVDRYLDGKDPIGQRIKFSRDEEAPWYTIQAVVGDVRHYGMDSEAPATVYIPFWRANPVRLTWVLRAAGDPLNLVDGVREAVHAVDPYQPLHDVRTLSRVVDESYWQWRLFSVMFRAIAVIALALAAVGIYGVMSQAVAQRTRELGIRMALGASHREVLRLVVWQGSKLVLLGLVIGVPMAFGLGKMMASVLFHITDFEPLTFSLVVAVIVLVSWWATAVPAHRAARTDPLDAIRYE